VQLEFQENGRKIRIEGISARGVEICQKFKARDKDLKAQ